MYYSLNKIDIKNTSCYLNFAFYVIFQGRLFTYDSAITASLDDLTKVVT